MTDISWIVLNKQPCKHHATKECTFLMLNVKYLVEKI